MCEIAGALLPVTRAGHYSHTYSDLLAAHINIATRVVVCVGVLVCVVLLYYNYVDLYLSHQHCF